VVVNKSCEPQLVATKMMFQMKHAGIKANDPSSCNGSSGSEV